MLFRSHNTGDFNLGNYNTGHFNLTNNSTGFFCTDAPKGINFFDKPTNITIDQWRKSDACKILSRIKTTQWIKIENMTEAEKNENVYFEEDKGYLKSIPLKEAIEEFWKTLSEEDKDIIKSIPNFDEGKFKKITGLSNLG